MRQYRTTRRPWWRAHRALARASMALAAGALAALAACDSLLSVDNPGNVPAASLDNPAMAPILDVSALGQFECAFTQFILTGGVLSGEYDVSTYFVDANQWGWRGVETKTQAGSCPGSRTTTSLGFFAPMQEARFMAEDAVRRISGFTDAQVPDRVKMLAELSAYAGYAYVLLGEGMCTMTVNNGPLMTRDDTWKLAEQRFADALGYASTADYTDITNMAHVGRARAELDLGDLPAAATDAQAVPAGYLRVSEYSEQTPARENRIYNMTIRNDFLTVDPAYRNLTVGGVPDPRVKVKNTGRNGQDGVTPQWQQQKYVGNGAAPVPLASWVEAQLIYAEAVATSDPQAAKDAINRVRASSGVAPLDGSEGSDVTAIVLEERRRQLFTEGQRLGDMLRKNIPFPSGVNHKGQTYGPTTCVPLPDVETQNNPNLKG
ncbi:MAG TPA: RagB/SusD family nutrient uptake outer membrane protein [Gemmatimonadaceae bacterium]|nr:RagB/SusD family nutrient uptake outer membrane protein [Gemmatimonadaceae bacterium]